MSWEFQVIRAWFLCTGTGPRPSWWNIGYNGLTRDISVLTMCSILDAWSMDILWRDTLVKDLINHTQRKVWGLLAWHREVPQAVLQCDPFCSSTLCYKLTCPPYLEKVTQSPSSQKMCLFFLLIQLQFSASWCRLMWIILHRGLLKRQCGM